MIEKEKVISIFRQVIDTESASGNLKGQMTIDVSPWDTSKMDGYKDGDKIHRGYTCRVNVLKLGLKPKNSFINFDPMNKDIEKALLDMFAEVKKLKK